MQEHTDSEPQKPTKQWTGASASQYHHACWLEIEGDEANGREMQLVVRLVGSSRFQILYTL